MTIPQATKYAIIGAGIHGLSTAYHLAQMLKATGRGGGKDIIIVDKTAVAAGASGIACGVVRNNYFQPAMRELMAHSVDVWESDAETFSYHPVGYMQISPECMREDVASIYEQQKAIGYESVFIEGADASAKYMKGLFDDWQARGITSVLHEKRGACETVVVGVGPWVNRIWNLLELPKRIAVKSNGKLHTDVPMWKFWCLEEGTLGVDPQMHRTNDGRFPPVLHVDTDAPLHSDRDGKLITEKLWGIYYKPDFNFGGVQGGASPYKVDQDPDKVAVDPYGPESPEFVVGEDFIDMWCSALAHCQKRFEGQMPHYRKEENSGGLGCFTPDNFPVFDLFRENVYVIADSNHGYKMIGVGKLVAQELMGEKSALLEPFRFARFAEGELHPTSHSPFPWS